MLDAKFFELADQASEWPFTNLARIADEARSLLHRIDSEQMPDRVIAMCKRIEERKADAICQAIEECVDRLLREGGPELQYYPPGREITSVGIRELLADWPDEADFDSPVPTAEDLSDLDALGSFLDSGWFLDSSQNPYEAQSSALGYDHELWALLALLKTGEAIWWLDRRGGRKPDRFQVALAGDSAIEGALALKEAVLAKAQIDSEFATWCRDYPEKLKKSLGDTPASSGAEAKRPKPPGAKGNEARRAQYAAMRRYTETHLMEEMRRGPIDQDQIFAHLLVEIPKRFPRRVTSKGGKRGEPLKVDPKTLKGWIDNAILLARMASKR